MNNYDLRKIKIEETIGVVFALLAGFFLCIASVTMFTNMVTRTTADINIKMVYELCQLCGAGVASFTIPYATMKSAHTEMDIITSHLKPRITAALEGIAGIVTVIEMCIRDSLGTGPSDQGRKPGLYGNRCDDGTPAGTGNARGVHGKGSG